MKRVQKTLAAILGLQLVVLGLISFRSQTSPPEHMASLDDGTIRDIEEFKRGLNVRLAADWLRLAEVYRAFGILPLADMAYRQAHRLKPKDPAYLYHWGITRSRAGDFDGAEKLLKLAIHNSVQSVEDCQFVLGKDRLRQELPAEAEPLLRNLSQRPDAALLLARLLQRTDRPKEASEMASRGLDLAANDVRFLQQKSWAEAAQGNTTVSEALRFRSMVARRWTVTQEPLYTRDYEIRQQFGNQRDSVETARLRAAGRVEEAKKHLEAVLAARWREKEAFELAELMLETSNPAQALNALSDYAARVGETGETLEMMARAALQTGDKSKAFAFAKRAHEFKVSRSVPSALSIHRMMAEHHRSQGDERATSRQMAEMNFELGKQALSENPSAALQSFNQAALLDPEFAHAWFYMGQCHELLGLIPQARSAYRKCLNLNTNHGRALMALRRIE